MGVTVPCPSSVKSCLPWGSKKLTTPWASTFTVRHSVVRVPSPVIADVGLTGVNTTE